MNNIAEFSHCSNCGACYNICPVDAICVREDGLFYEVAVDDDKCIRCGLCKKVCPVNTPENRQQVQAAYGLIHNNADIVKVSSSGGAFSAMADYVLSKRGVVFGAVYADDGKSVEIHSTETRSLDDLRRSKYVESKVGNSFREVKSVLTTTPDQLVLYCGAPCQIAGLKRYLGKDYENLITCDFSCGGMPSHKMYAEYVSSIEKKLGSPIKDVNFRPKTYGWLHHAIQITGANGKRYRKLAIADTYFSCFIGTNYHHSSTRDYCMHCDFADNHYADVILADFWKYQTASNIQNDDTGISLIVTNSAKGERIIKEISKNVALTILDKDKACYNLVKKNFSDEVIQRRAAFIEEVEQKGFVAVAKTLKLSNPLKFKVKRVIKKLIGRV